ncbi:hypothetical protein BHM03_00006403 [Ensete ventricosum]|nr:hypothetical protein BHM03_00006403 [Ensete ventricosum]
MIAAEPVSRAGPTDHIARTAEPGRPGEPPPPGTPAASPPPPRGQAHHGLLGLDPTPIPPPGSEPCAFFFFFFFPVAVAAVFLSALEPSPPLPFRYCFHHSAHCLVGSSEERQRDVCMLNTAEGGGAGEARRGLRTIDVNQPPPAGAAAGRPDSVEADASSPNSAVSSVGGKRPAEREAEHDAEPSCSRGASDEEEGDGDGDGSRKKLRLSKDQSSVLEESFKEHTTLSTVRFSFPPP